MAFRTNRYSTGFNLHCQKAGTVCIGHFQGRSKKAAVDVPRYRQWCGSTQNNAQSITLQRVLNREMRFVDRARYSIQKTVQLSPPNLDARR